MNMKDVNEFENEQVNEIDGGVQSELSQYEAAEQKIAEFNKQLMTGDIKVDSLNSGGLNVNDGKNYTVIEGLPSKGRLYPEGTLIKARPLKVIEVKKLASLTDSTANYVINDILNSCVRGIDVNNLYLADKVFIIFWLRSQSFKDPNYVVNFKCSNCKKESDYHFEIDTVTVTHLDEEFDNNLTLPNGDVLYIDFLTVADELAVSSFNNKNAIILEHSDIEIDSDLLSLSFMIKSINGNAMIDFDRYKYLYDMDPQEYSFITSYYKIYDKA